MAENSTEAVEESNKGSENGAKRETFADLIEEKGRESSFSSEFLSSETTHEEHSRSSTEDSSSSPSVGWPVQEIAASDCASPHGSEDGEKKHLVLENKEFEKRVSASPGIQGVFYAHNLLISVKCVFRSLQIWLKLILISTF